MLLSEVDTTVAAENSKAVEALHSHDSSFLLQSCSGEALRLFFVSFGAFRDLTCAPRLPRVASRSRQQLALEYVYSPRHHFVFEMCVFCEIFLLCRRRSQLEERRDETAA